MRPSGYIVAGRSGMLCERVGASVRLLSVVMYMRHVVALAALAGSSQSPFVPQRSSPSNQPPVRQSVERPSVLDAAAAAELLRSVYSER